MVQIPDQTDKTTAAAADRLIIRDVTSNTDKDTTVSGLAPAIVASIAADAITPAMMNGIDLFGRTSAAWAGSTPPAAGSGQFYMQAGLTNITTNASGDATITFPTPFPNGVMCVVATNSGSLSDLATASVMPGSTSGFNVSSNEKSGPVNFSWIAIGW